MELQPYGQDNSHDTGAQTLVYGDVTGLSPCDSRYRNIIGQLDSMMETVRQQPDCQLTKEIDFLLNYMMHHIGSENRFMELVNYPHAIMHRHHHYNIFEIVDDLKHRLTERQNLLPEELVNIRTLWLTHIQMHDRAFEEYLGF